MENQPLELKYIHVQNVNEDNYKSSTWCDLQKWDSALVLLLKDCWDYQMGLMNEAFRESLCKLKMQIQI